MDIDRDREISSFAGEAGRGSLLGQATEEQRRRLAEPVCPVGEKTSERVLYS